MDCFEGVSKAQQFGLFSLDDFDVLEYERLSKHGEGDLNWVIPNRLLAFAGPSTDGKQDPDYYLDYFWDSNVSDVVRLNEKETYDSEV